MKIRMNKLKEINSRYYQECEVVMLAAEKATTIFLSKDKLEYFKSFTEHGQSNLTKMHKSNHIKPQHLYFLSNEEIKEGDWCYNKITKQITQAKTSFYGNFNWVKIIATTDISLGLPQPSKEFIQAYIKAYNENKPINKVLVEMEFKANHAFPQLILKVNSSSEITIKKIKDIYTREELPSILQSYLDYCHFSGYITPMKFIEENL